MKKNENFYAKAAIIGSLTGLFFTVFAYLVVMMMIVGETFIVAFLVMVSFGIIMGLTAAYLLKESNKLFGIRIAKSKR